jgi:hypothetical protein
MLINKITVGWVTQVYDTDKNKFISQEFFAGDQVDYENIEGVVVTDKEIYLEFEMVQPDIRYIQIVDSDFIQLGILKTNADDITIDKLLEEYSIKESDDKSVEGFIVYCSDSNPEFIFERHYLDGEKVVHI